MNTDTLVRQAEGDLFVGSSRITVRQVIAAYVQGQAPEQVQASYPSLSLAEIHGAIIYYLEHQAELDARFVEEDRALDAAHAATYAEHAQFYDQMRKRFEAAHAQDSEQPDEGKAPEA